MEPRTTIPKQPSQHYAGLRWFSAILGLWLLCVPQVMYSTTVMDLVKETGNKTLPLIEEEEVKHSCTQPTHFVVALIGPLMKLTDLFSAEDRITSALHGDVPHLPPWA